MAGQMLDPAAMAQQRLAVSEKLRGMTAPGGQPMPQPAPQQPPDTSPFTFSNPGQIPDIRSLILAMLKSGMTHSNTKDIELQPSVEDLVGRAQRIPGM